jgi:hypothetical protein
MYFTQEDFKKIQDWLNRHGVKDTELPKANNIEGDEIITVVQNGNNKKLKAEDLLKTINNQSILGSGNITIDTDKKLKWIIVD